MENVEQGKTQAELPRYRSHKIVWALKISGIEPTDDGAIILPTEEGFGPFKVDLVYVKRHNPKVNGYYVVYEDGYKSWSPEKAFEDGYTAIIEGANHGK